MVRLGPRAARAVEAVLLIDPQQRQRGALHTHLLLGDAQRVPDRRKPGRGVLGLGDLRRVLNRIALGRLRGHRGPPPSLAPVHYASDPRTRHRQRPWRLPPPAPTPVPGRSRPRPELVRSLCRGGRASRLSVGRGRIGGVAETASKKTDKTSGGDRPRLMLMDGHSLAYRAFFALPAENFTTATGQPTNAIYGFASMLANTLRDEAPTHFAVAFDVSRKTWRSEEFTEYKANRSKTPDEFKGQVELIGELLDAMHVPLRGGRLRGRRRHRHARHPGRGRGLRRADRHRRPRLLPARVRAHHRALPDEGRLRADPVHSGEGRREVRVDARPVPRLRGPARRPSDNLPGIPGVGEKTAAKWINQFGSFAELVDRADEVKGKAGQNLRDHLDAVKLNRRLTEMVKDVELPKTVVDLERAPYDRTGVAMVLDTLEIRNPSLRERLLAVDPGAEEAEPTPPAESGVAVDGSVLGTGELTGWLADYGTEPLGVATVDTWALGTGSVTEVALATAGEPPPGSTPPSWTRATRTPSRPGCPTPTAPRCSTTPRARCGSSPTTVGPSAASPWTPRSPPTWSSPAAAPSTWTRCPWSTSAVSWPPPPRPTASSRSARTTAPRRTP